MFLFQKSQRECRLSEEIDDEFEQEREKMIEIQRKKEEEAEEEYSFIMADEDGEEGTPSCLNSSEIHLNTSLNRSGLARDTKQYAVKEVQTEYLVQEQPKIRKIRDCTDGVKSTCVELSVKCNISAEMSRTAVQTVCKGIYQHNYYLSKEEAIEKDPGLAELKQVESNTTKKKTET